jgi:hypothetical protein
VLWTHNFDNDLADTFANAGFGGRETVRETDLQFDPNLSKSISSWPEERVQITKQIRKTEKALPQFPYDITPREEKSTLVDELFFEAWADVLVSSGWSRDEWKESSWVLVQWRTKPSKDSLSMKKNADGRTDEKWFLVEEMIPPEYREELIDGGKVTFFFASWKFCWSYEEI